MCLHGNTSHVLEQIFLLIRLAQQTDVALTDMDKGMHTGTILIDLMTDEQHKLIMYFNLLEITSCCGNREMV